MRVFLSGLGMLTARKLLLLGSLTMYCILFGFTLLSSYLKHILSTKPHTSLFSLKGGQRGIHIASRLLSANKQ